MKTSLQLEELAPLTVALLVFAHLPCAWWWLPALLLVPDLSLLGYLAGPRVGAWCYSLVHYKLLAVALGTANYLLAQPALLLVGTVLLGHSSLDRLLGYGLEYETGFGDTRLGRIGRRIVA